MICTKCSKLINCGMYLYDENKCELFEDKYNKPVKDKNKVKIERNVAIGKNL